MKKNPRRRDRSTDRTPNLTVTDARLIAESDPGAHEPRMVRAARRVLAREADSAIDTYDAQVRTAGEPTARNLRHLDRARERRAARLVAGTEEVA